MCINILHILTCHTVSYLYISYFHTIKSKFEKVNVTTLIKGTTIYKYPLKKKSPTVIVVYRLGLNKLEVG